MARYSLPSGDDAVDQALQEVSNLEHRVNVLEGRRLSTWDRGFHGDVAAPAEGQHIVEADTEAVWYYSNGAWRKLGAGVVMEWMRRRKFEQSPLQVIGSGSETAVTWNSSDVSDATMFTSSGNGIRVEQAGFYDMVCRLFWDTDPGAHAIMFNGVDPDAFAGYPGAAAAQSSFNLIGMVSMGARLAEGQTVTVTVRHTAGANRSLWSSGSYIELRHLGSATTTGRDS